MCKFLLKMKLRSTYLVWIFLILHSEGQSQIPEKTKREASPYKRPVDVTTSDAARICKEKGLPYYNGASNHSCCGCPAGEYRTGDCPVNKLEETPCVPCTNNRTMQTFTSNPNTLTSCNISQSPQACESLMYTKFKRGNQTTDNRCVCVYGTYPKNFDSNVYGCIPHTKCKTGFGVKIYGNETNDVECEKCLPGMCSNETSATARCKPCDGNLTNPTSSPPTQASSPPNQASSPPNQASSPPNQCSTEQSFWIRIGFGIGIVVAFLVGVVVGQLIYRLHHHCLPRYFARRPGTTNVDVEMNRHYNTGANGNAVSNSASTPGTNGNVVAGPASTSSEDSVHTENDHEDSPLLNNETANANAPTQSLENRSQDDHEVPTAQTPTITSTRNSNASQEMDEWPTPSKVEEEEKLLSPQSMNSDGNEVFSADVTDGSSVKEGRIEQNIGHLTELAEDQLTAKPYMPKDNESSVGCERTMNQEDYMPLFERQGYNIWHESDEGADNQFIAILMFSDRSLSYDQAKTKVEQLRGQIIEHISKNRRNFESEILQQYGSFEEYLRKLRSHTTPGDEYTLRAAEQLHGIEFRVIKPNDATEPSNHTSQTRFLGLVDRGFYVCLEPNYGNQLDPHSSAQRVPSIDSRVEQQPEQQPSSSSNDGTQTSETVTYSEPGEEKDAADEPNNGSPSLDAGFSYKDLIEDEDLRKRLEKFPEEEVYAKLRSKELARQMLNSLENHRYVKDFVRLSGLLEKPENVIEDAEEEFPRDCQNQRRRMLKKLQDNQKVKPTPKSLLDCCQKNDITTVYDDLCEDFVKRIEKEYRNRSIHKKNGKN